ISGNDDALADATVRLTDALLAQLPGQQASPAPLAAKSLSSSSSSPTAAPPAGGLSSSAAATATTDHTSAFVAIGAAGALAAGAVAMTLVTRSTYNDVADPKKPLDQSEADSLKWKGPVADALWVAAIGAAGLGTYLYFSASP